MLYVVVEELIPEMSAGEHSNIGTVFFAVGFSLMMILELIKNRWRYQPTHDWGLHLKIYFYFWDSGTGNLSYMILNIFFFGDNNILWTEDIGYNIVSTVPD